MRSWFWKWAMMLVLLIGSMRSAHAALLAEGAGGESFWVKPGVGESFFCDRCEEGGGKEPGCAGRGWLSKGYARW